MGRDSMIADQTQIPDKIYISSAVNRHVIHSVTLSRPNT